jgi:nitrogen fixation NifU-like protein
MTDAGAFAALYRDHVLEHGRHPRHAGELAGATHAANAHNTLCGDRIALGLRLDGEGRIAELRHRSEGCLLCLASASLMACDVSGRDAAGVAARFSALRESFRLGDGEGLGELGALAGVGAHPARQRCVLLPWEALTEALAGPPR